MNEVLSIVIPHYNSPDTLKRLLDSVLDECRDAKIIVVDDKSNKELDKLEQLEKDYRGVFFIHNNTDKKGAGVCRNLGIRSLDSKWVLFADADDYFVKGWYQAVSKYFESDYEVVYFSPEGSRGQYYVQQVNKYISGKNAFDIRVNYNVPWSKLIKTELIKRENLTYDEVMWANDVMFATKTGIKAKSVHADNAVIYCVTEQEQSLITNPSKAAFLTRAEVEARRVRYLKDNLSPGQYKDYQCMTLLLMYLKAGKLYDKGTAKRILEFSKEYKMDMFPSLKYLLNKSFGKIITG